MKPEIKLAPKASIVKDIWLKELSTSAIETTFKFTSDSTFEPFKIYFFSDVPVLIDGYKRFLHNYDELPEYLNCLDYSDEIRERIYEYLLFKYFSNSPADALKIAYFFKFVFKNEVSENFLTNLFTEFKIYSSRSETINLITVLPELPEKVKAFIRTRQIPFKDFQLQDNLFGNILTSSWQLLDYCNPSWNQFKDILTNIKELSFIQNRSSEIILNELIEESLRKNKNSTEFLNLLKENIIVRRYPNLIKRKNRFDQIIKKNQLQKFLKPLNRFEEKEELKFEINLKSKNELDDLLLSLNKMAVSKNLEELFELI